MVLAGVVIVSVFLSLYLKLRVRKTYIYRSAVVYTGRQMQGGAPAQSLRTVLATAKSVARLKKLKKKFKLEGTIRSLSKMFTVKPLGRNHVIEVTYRCRNNKQAYEILTFFVQDYAAEVYEMYVKHLRGRERSYQRNLRRYRKERIKVQQELKQMQTQTGYLGTEYSLKPLLDERGRVMVQTNTTRQRLKRLRIELKKLRHYLKHMSRSQLLKIERSNPIRVKYLDIQAQIRGLAQTYTKNHPKMRQLLAQRGALRRQMNPRTLRSLWSKTFGINQVRQNILERKLLLEAEQAALRKQLPVFEKRLKKYNKRLAEVPLLSKRHRNLKFRLQELEGSITVLATSHVRIASELKARRVLLDRIDPPSFVGTTSPKKRRIIVAGLSVVSMMFVMALFLFLAWRDDVIRYPFELKEANATILGETKHYQFNNMMLWSLHAFMSDKQGLVVVPLQEKDQTLLPPMSSHESLPAVSGVLPPALPMLMDTVEVAPPLFENGQPHIHRFHHVYQHVQVKIFWVVLSQTKRSQLLQAIQAMEPGSPVALMYTSLPKS